MAPEEKKKEREVPTMELTAETTSMPKHRGYIDRLWLPMRPKIGAASDQYIEKACGLRHTSPVTREFVRFCFRCGGRTGARKR